MLQWPGDPHCLSIVLKRAKAEGVDRLLLAGDNISFPTLANVEFLKCKLDACGVRIVLVDNSLYHVTPEQLAFWESEIARGDPTLLVMHIPFWQPGWSVSTCACPTWGAATDPYWEIERRERWAEQQMPSTFAFRDAAVSAPNLISVVAGHEHRYQVAEANGHPLVTAPANGKGDVLPVLIVPKEKSRLSRENRD